MHPIWINTDSLPALLIPEKEGKAHCMTKEATKEDLGREQQFRTSTILTSLHENDIQCVHGSTAIVRHMVSPLYDDVSKIHVCGFILVFVMPGYSKD